MATKFRPLHDRILVRSIEDVQLALQSTRPGQTVQLGVLRNGTQYAATITLQAPAGAAPTAPSQPTAPPATRPGTGVPPAAPAQGVSAGSYECWAYGESRALMNFTIRSANQYVDSEGKTGGYRLETNGHVTFQGGGLDGILPDGFYAMYYAPGGRPTVSFRNASGNEVSYCERG